MFHILYNYKQLVPRVIRINDSYINYQHCITCFELRNKKSVLLSCKLHELLVNIFCVSEPEQLQACWHVNRPELHARSRDVSRLTEVWICTTEFNVKSPLTSQLHVLTSHELTWREDSVSPALPTSSDGAQRPLAQNYAKLDIKQPI
jgi:hypothetical protein